MVYLISVKPFDNRLLNYLEVFNEMCIQANSYLMLLFTDCFMIESPNNFGWIMISITGVSIVINTAVMLVMTFLHLKELIR